MPFRNDKWDGQTRDGGWREVRADETRCEGWRDKRLRLERQEIKA